MAGGEGPIKVDYGELTRLEQAAVNGSSKLQTEIANSVQAANNARGVWEQAQAADAFTTHFEQLKNRATAHEQALKEFGDFIGTANQGYQAADLQALRFVQNF